MNTLFLLILSPLVIALPACDGFSFKQTRTKTSTPILTASEEDKQKVQFDTGCVANPVIIPPRKEGDEWLCYYYGNDGSWKDGINCFLPTGFTGLATSPDGLTSWTKIPGSDYKGSILGPSEGSWDSVHTGVGDVIRLGENELHMYYLGGDKEEFMGMKGLRMRIGRAKSIDNGRTWTKDNDFLFDYDESEGLFASWPRIVRFEDKDQPWKMFYHSYDTKKWRVYSAESTDQGDSWKRTGLVLEGSDEEDHFDFQGIGTRSVTHWRDGLLMIYEGVNKDGKHSLGAAFCDDVSKNKWTKLNDGRPILEPGKGSLGQWTEQVIGTPFVLSMPDGSLRIYHCGKDGPDGKMAIGVVISESGNVEPNCWVSNT